MRTIFEKIDWILSKIEDIIVNGSMAIMLIVLFAQIVMRYLFNTPLIWSEEVARYLFVYFTFIGIGLGIRKNSHIRMEMAINLLPKKVKEILDIILNLIFAGFFLWLTPQSIPFLKSQMLVYTTATRVPMHYIFIALPVGMTIAALRLIMKSICEIQEFGKKEEV